jgi:hypothetical protein
MHSRDGQGADIRAGPRHMPVAGSRKFVEQRFCVFQIGGVEALGEPFVNGCQQLARFSPPPLLAPQAGEARRSAQLQQARFLSPSCAQGIRQALFDSFPGSLLAFQQQGVYRSISAAR